MNEARWWEREHERADDYHERRSDMTDFADKAEFGARALALSKSELALLVDFGEREPLWVPCSQIDDDSEVWKPGQEGTIILSEWWAKKAGLL